MKSDQELFELIKSVRISTWLLAYAFFSALIIGVLLYIGWILNIIIPDDLYLYHGVSGAVALFIGGPVRMEGG